MSSGVETGAMRLASRPSGPGVKEQIHPPPFSKKKGKHDVSSSGYGIPKSKPPRQPCTYFERSISMEDLCAWDDSATDQYVEDGDVFKETISAWNICDNQDSHGPSIADLAGRGGSVSKGDGDFQTDTAKEIPDQVQSDEALWRHSFFRPKAKPVSANTSSRLFATEKILRALSREGNLEKVKSSSLNSTCYRRDGNDVTTGPGSRTISSAGPKKGSPVNITREKMPSRSLSAPVGTYKHKEPTGDVRPGSVLSSTRTLTSIAKTMSRQNPVQYRPPTANGSPTCSATTATPSIKVKNLIPETLDFPGPGLKLRMVNRRGNWGPHDETVVDMVNVNSVDICDHQENQPQVTTSPHTELVHHQIHNQLATSGMKTRSPTTTAMVNSRRPSLSTVTISEPGPMYPVSRKHR